MLRISLLVLVLLIHCQGRIFETSILFSEFGRRQGWIYLDKMTFEPGIGEIKLETRTEGLSMGGIGEGKGIILQAIPFFLWERQQASKCYTQPLDPNFHQIHMPSHQNLTQMLDKTQIVISVAQESMYYFVIKDCAHMIQPEFNNSNLRLYIRLTMTNNGSKVGAEEDHWYIIPIVIALGFWMAFQNRHGLNIQEKDIDWAKMLLFVGIGANMSSLTWKSVGFIIYSLTGSDYVLFHLVYLFMHSLSESFVIGLIILIAFGWSINYTFGRDFDLYLPFMSILAFMNVVMTLLTKINNQEHDRHHMFDSVPGTLLIIFRLCLIVVYLGGLIYTYLHSRYKVKQFIWKFGVMGLFYLAALPIILLVGKKWVRLQQQNEFVFVTVQIVKTTCNILLTYVISSKKSEYQEVSQRNSSFMPDEPKFN